MCYTRHGAQESCSAARDFAEKSTSIFKILKYHPMVGDQLNIRFLNEDFALFYCSQEREKRSDKVRTVCADWNNKN